MSDSMLFLAGVIGGLGVGFGLASFAFSILLTQKLTALHLDNLAILLHETEGVTKVEEQNNLGAQAALEQLHTDNVAEAAELKATQE
jgi:hypothetical protein